MASVNPRFCVYFVSEVSMYTFYDLVMPHERPLRAIHDEEIICYCTSKNKAQLVADTFNEQGLI